MRRRVPPVNFEFCLRRWLTGALGVFLLLGVPPSVMAAATKPATSILLVAQNQVSDPFFADSIVLVMNNLGPEPIGIIINRPTSVPVARLFPALTSLKQVSDKLYFGGPVEFGTVWFLVRTATRPAHAVQVCDGVYLSADRDLLRRLLGRHRPMAGLRIFVGHAGWAPGQLQAEIARGDWHLRRAESEAIFSDKSLHPWPAPKPPAAGARPTASAQT